MCSDNIYHAYPENVSVWHYVSGDPLNNHSSKRKPPIKFIRLIPSKEITMRRQVNKYTKRNFSANVQLPLTTIKQNGRKGGKGI